MMQPAFDHTRYTTVVFMDSMVALEARPFAALPWSELDTGAILVLVVPQVCTEIDKRKRDGRLGRRAREFNRMIAPAAEQAHPVRICDGSPTVDIGIARTTKIDWDRLDDLDPEDADARVVAQILHACDVPPERKMLFSQDTNPIVLASRHGLKSRRLSDHWLMDPEPSPSDKEVQRLKGRVRELEADKPILEVDVQFGVAAPVRIFRIEPLSDGDRSALAAMTLAKTPKIEQRIFPYHIGMSNYDSSYDDKYRLYRDDTVPRYTSSVHQFFEVHYAQVPFTLTLRNTGYVQAENLVLSLVARGGTLHDRFTVYPLFGPTSPEPRDGLSPFRAFEPPRMKTVARHEVHFAVGPNRTDRIEVHCADFRHGREWVFNGIATLDPRTPGQFEIEVRATAANKPGFVEECFTLPYEVETACLEDLVDIRTKDYKIAIPMHEQFIAAVATMNVGWIEFVKLDGVRGD